jgi:hypothetical protein
MLIKIIIFSSKTETEAKKKILLEFLISFLSAEFSDPFLERQFVIGLTRKDFSVHLPAVEVLKKYKTAFTFP